MCKEDTKEVLVSQNVGGGKQLDRAFHFDKVQIYIAVGDRIHSTEAGQELVGQHIVKEKLPSSWCGTATSKEMVEVLH